MSDLSRWSKDLIASARGEGAPSPEAKARVRGAVLRAAAAGAPDDTAPRPGGDAGGRAVALKALAPIALGLALAFGGGWLATRAEPARDGPSEGPSPPSATPDAGTDLEDGSLPRAVVAPGSPGSPGEDAVADAASGGSSAPRAGPSPRGEATRAAPSIRPAPPPNEPNGASTLEEEMRLVREAQAALRRGDSAGARRPLDEHARRFPSGTLTLERDGLRAIALCQAGAPGAEREARAFVAANASAPIATRVRAACRLEP